MSRNSSPSARRDTAGPWTSPENTSKRRICIILATTIILVSAVIVGVVVWAVNASHDRGEQSVSSTLYSVSTPLGRFVGVPVTSTTYAANYVVYRSVPFAKPPIGDLRFRRPQPLDNTDPDLVLNNDGFKPSCWSVTKKSTDSAYHEDCLYLNIYVPINGSTPSVGATQLPVMVWFHGGGFVAGSTFPEPEKLVIRGGVVVVSVNYRLGVFGFLTAETDALPSNNGLWDQHMALKWVGEYVGFFGGDKNQITIFGSSAGSISASIHALSPISSGLFSKAILQSGTATSLISRDARHRALEFAALVSCTGHVSDTELAVCLRRVSVADILQFSKPSAFNMSLARQQIDFLWMPVIDGTLIPDEPIRLLKNTTYLHQVGALGKDFLIGVVNNEGALIVENFLRPIPLSQVTTDSFTNDVTGHLLNQRYQPNPGNIQTLRQAVLTFYTGSQDGHSRSIPQNILDLVGDVIFVVPALEMALALSGCQQTNSSTCPGQRPPSSCPSPSSKVYLYHFDYCPRVKDECKAACTTHGADVAYEFPRAQFPDPSQQQLSDTFVNILTAFAKTSNPASGINSEWPPFEQTNQRYLRLDVATSVRGFLYNYRVNFWLNVVPSLYS